MRALIRTQFDILLGPGSDFVPVMLYEWRSLTPRQRADIALLAREYEAAWVPVLQALRDAGRLRADVRLARLFILGALNWTVQWFDPKKAATLDDLTDAAMDLFLQESLTCPRRSRYFFSFASSISTLYEYPEPRSLSVCTMPVTRTTSPIFASSVVVTSTSLVLSAAEPEPSRRWTQFLPITAGVNLTTLPRTTTVLSLSSALLVTISATVRAFGAGGLRDLDVADVRGLRDAGVHRRQVAALAGAAGTGARQHAEDDPVELAVERLALEVVHDHRVLDGHLGALLDRGPADGRPGLAVLGLQAQVRVAVDVLHFEDFAGERRGGGGLRRVGGPARAGEQQHDDREQDLHGGLLLVVWRAMAGRQCGSLTGKRGVPLIWIRLERATGPPHRRKARLSGRETLACASP